MEEKLPKTPYPNEHAPLGKEREVQALRFPEI
jgi:hypothetical protein